MSRVDDVRMLHDALALQSLYGDAREAFEDMLERLEARPGSTLSEKQREWIKKTLGEPNYENLVSSGKVSKVVRHNHGELATCDAACPAWTPPSLRNLPKRPPTRSA